MIVIFQDSQLFTEAIYWLNCHNLMQNLRHRIKQALHMLGWIREIIFSCLETKQNTLGICGLFSKESSFLLDKFMINRGRLHMADFFFLCQCRELPSEGSEGQTLLLLYICNKSTSCGRLAVTLNKRFSSHAGYLRHGECRQLWNFDLL